MSGGTGKPGLDPLSREQQRAVDPAHHVWLGASAGTGKTQVLAARVLRLLLSGARPDSLLCITFTKAGAAEMARRIHDRLAYWVRADGRALDDDLRHLGLIPDATLRDHARTLFAQVIDSRHGAINVATLHGFSQALLGSFPLEAGMMPGFRLVEDPVEIQRLQDAIWAAMLGDDDPLAPRHRDRLAALSLTLDPKRLRGLIEQAARVFGRAGTPQLPPTTAAVRDALGLPVGDAYRWLRDELAGGAVADGDVTALAGALAGWGNKTGRNLAERCTNWLALSADARADADALADLRGSVVTKEGTLRADYTKPALAPVADAAQRVADGVQRLLATTAGMRFADQLTDLWAMGAAFASDWGRYKAAHGIAEYDDLIQRAAQLLGTISDDPTARPFADWVRYKLDQRIDHVLVDEAQDTNRAQWDIVGGLTGEYFAGLGARDDAARSLFVVGDRKQAIFGFQGTDPAAFEDARARFARAAEGADNPLENVELAANYRSAPAILTLVDRWIADGAGVAMGLAGAVGPHQPFHSRTPGRVELWSPLIIGGNAGDASADDSHDGDDGDDNGGGGAGGPVATDSASVMLARAIADRVAHWLADGHAGRAVQPGNVLVLVRKRTDLAARLVAQLQARGVPVAGVDRFRLTGSLVVQDLMAAMRFCVQPGDELSLAALLVSPLIGWSHDELDQMLAGRDRTGLWQWLRGHDSDRARTACAVLDDWLALADFTPPHDFLTHLLTGPTQGRARMIARMGRESIDAMDALMTQALAHARTNVPTLSGFLAWLDGSEAEMKRRADQAGDTVRVMTVHGAKGLQAPIVILADATSVPLRGRVTPRITIGALDGLPMWVDKQVTLPALTEAVERAWQQELAEHWRLGYVALTRAERLLIITGTAKPTKSDPMPIADDSWYASTARALEGLGAGCEAGVGAWAERRIWANAPGQWTRTTASARTAPSAPPPLPGWLHAPAPDEPRPPRPLAPSQLGDDNTGNAPAGPDRKAAIRRGTLMHALFERLPDVVPARRRGQGAAWLARMAADVAPGARASMLADVLGVLDYPDWQPLFGPDSLAEAPFSALVGDQVIAGTVDRLLVRDDAVLVVDFKTGLAVPDDASRIAPAYLRQMAAYAAALAVLFPGRRVQAALLFSSAPRLFVLDDVLLAAHEPVGIAAPAP